MDFVIHFRRYKLLRIKGNGVELFIKTFLKKKLPLKRNRKY